MGIDFQDVIWKSGQDKLNLRLNTTNRAMRIFF